MTRVILMWELRLSDSQREKKEIVVEYIGTVEIEGRRGGEVWQKAPVGLHVPTKRGITDERPNGIEEINLWIQRPVRQCGMDGTRQT